mmetsp:Transcript_56092/g.156269  ORF Transcript_56092/g.156269 Transcript_56092/m.156269 type:complete len:291 (+) Transcript_56092:758-1630(+)
MTILASAGLPIRIRHAALPLPFPLHLPLSNPLSCGASNLTEVTVPSWPKTCCNVSSVVSPGIPLTYKLSDSSTSAVINSPMPLPSFPLPSPLPLSPASCTMIASSSPVGTEPLRFSMAHWASASAILTKPAALFLPGATGRTLHDMIMLYWPKTSWSFSSVTSVGKPRTYRVVPSSPFLPFPLPLKSLPLNFPLPLSKPSPLNPLSNPSGLGRDGPAILTTMGFCIPWGVRPLRLSIIHCACSEVLQRTKPAASGFPAVMGRTLQDTTVQYCEKISFIRSSVNSAGRPLT